MLDKSIVKMLVGFSYITNRTQYTVLLNTLIEHTPSWNPVQTL